MVFLAFLTSKQKAFSCFYYHCTSFHVPTFSLLLVTFSTDVFLHLYSCSSLQYSFFFFLICLQVFRCRFAHTTGGVGRRMKHDTLELRFCTLVIQFSEGGSVVLLSGAASILGAPLELNVRYHFEHESVPIDIPSSARLDVDGSYVCHQALLNAEISALHSVLDASRAAAEASAAKDNSTSNRGDSLGGPRVLVVGDQNTGKTSLCRALLNMGTKDGKFGIAFVDVDVGQQSVSVPGSIATVFCESRVPVDDGFNSAMPLSFFFGDKVVTAASRKRYLDLCACTSQACAAVGHARPSFGAGGLIINTMGWVAELGRDILIELMSIFAVTHIIVTGGNSELERVLSDASMGRDLTVLRYGLQSSLMKRTATRLASYRTRQLAKYFRGTARMPLSVVRSVAKVADVSFLAALTLQPMAATDVRPLSVAAVSLADSADTAAEANVAGYVVIVEIGRKYFSFLSPCAGDLPKPFLLVSSTITLPAASVPSVKA